MAIPLAEQILGVVKEGLSAWKTFISTRQEAYNRQQDKKQVAAIENAEKYILIADGLITKIEALELDKDNKFKEDIKNLKRYRARFFKYN